MSLVRSQPGMPMADRLSDDVIELISRRFRALAEPARLTILNRLMEREMTVSELVEDTDLNQANVSKHLQHLRATGFVRRRKDGLFSHYRLADPSVRTLCEIMCAQLEDQAERRAALLANED